MSTSTLEHDFTTAGDSLRYGTFMKSSDDDSIYPVPSLTTASQIMLAPGLIHGLHPNLDRNLGAASCRFSDDCRPRTLAPGFDRYPCRRHHRGESYICMH